MVKRIGRLLAACLLFAYFQVHSSVELRALTPDGKLLKQAAVGSPFILEVVVSADKDGDFAPQVEGLNRFVSSGAGVSTEFRSVNGVSRFSKRYRYRIVANQQGRFRIGPATANIDGKVVRSHELELEVAKRVEAQGTSSNASRGSRQKVFLEFDCDRAEAYVGEKLTVFLRVYVAEDAELGKLSDPNFGDAKVVEVDKTMEWVEVAGEPYAMYEFAFLVFPKSSGEVVFPAAQAQYSFEVEDRHNRRHRFGVFEDMMGMFGRRMRTDVAYSEAITIKVSELPPHQPPTDLIGKFKKACLELEKTSIKTGEGVVLTLSITGDGNLSIAKHPELKLPKELKYYESGSELKGGRDSSGMETKKFEYVLQAVSGGDIEIVPQTIYYFDPTERKYEALNTDSLSVVVSGETVGETPPPIAKKKESPGLFVEAGVLGGLMPIRPYDGRYLAVSSSQIAPRWFWTFVLMLLLLMLYPLVLALIMWHKRKLDPILARKLAFSNGRREVQKIIMSGKTDKLYATIQKVFAERFGVEPSEVNGDFIEDRLKKAGFSTVELKKWSDFLLEMEELSFFGRTGDGASKKALASAAAEWFLEFERRMKA